MDQGPEGVYRLLREEYTMKKLIACLLAAACLLGLCACGAQENVTLDLAEIYSQMAEATDEELVQISAERVLDLYGIKPDQCAEQLIYSYNSGMMAAEIWLIKASSAEAMTELKAKAEKRLEYLDAESITYSPEMNKVVKKAQIIVRGDYLAMICSQNVEALAKVFNEA